MMKKEYEIFVLLFFPGVLSQHVLNPPDSMIVDKGQIAYIPCKMLNSTVTQKADCIWSWNEVSKPMITHKYFFDKISKDGDCGLLIFDTELDQDDGLWHCEIRTQNDTLFAHSINLVVAEAPSSPIIKYGEKNEFEFVAGHPYSLECHSTPSNPPSVLKWFLNGEEILMGTNQTTFPHPGRPKTWITTSVLNFSFQAKDFNKTLECVSEHNGYESSVQRAIILPDVMFAPTAKEISTNLSGGKDVVEGISLVLECVVEANPQPIIFWTGPYEELTFDDGKILLDPVSREDAGIYTCSANNSLGASHVISKTIDVKFIPEIQIAGRFPQDKANLYHAVTFICKAEGNPLPSYSWRKRVKVNPEEWHEEALNSNFYIEQADYESQGFYTCLVYNTINGKTNSTKSNEIFLDVVGPPQIIKKKSSSEVESNRGETANILIHFCSDPQPYVTYWILGDGRILATNSTYSRYSASEVKPIGKLDCYEARLNLEDSKHRDSGSISFVVTNFNGTVKQGVMLTVKGLDIDIIVAVTVTAGLIAILLVGFAVIKFRKTEPNAAAPSASAETSSTAQIFRSSDTVRSGGSEH